jgi:hypothetical protein
VTRTITQHDVDDLELSAPTKGQSSDDMLRERIDVFVEWANDPETVLDGVTRASLLAVSAEHCVSIGEPERALELARISLATGDHDAFGAFPQIITALFELGRDGEVAEEVTAARAAVRDDPRAFDWTVMERIGEELAYFGQLEAAERWFSLCVRTVDRGAAAAAADLALPRALTFRWAVRRRAGKATDVMDLEAERAAAEQGWENPDPLIFREDEQRGRQGLRD